MDKRESSAGCIADQSGSNQAPSSLRRLTQKEEPDNRLLECDLVRVPLVELTDGDNLFLDIICGNIEPIIATRKNSDAWLFAERLAC